MNPLTGEKLDANMLGLVRVASEGLGASQVALLQQASVARIVTSTATMIDVEVPSGLPAVDVPNGPLPGQNLVIKNDELAGEVIVWVRGGLFIGVEQSWYTDTPPTSWPHPAEIERSV